MRIRERSSTLTRPSKRPWSLSPEIREARAGLLFAEAQKNEALANRWVQIEVNTLVAPSLNAEGDQVASSSEFSSIDDIGLWLSADVLAVQPLYTFGRLSQMIKAAQKGIEVEKAGIDLTVDEVILKTKEFYYGPPTGPGIPGTDYRGPGSVQQVLVKS